MLGYLSDFEKTFAAMDDFRRRMERFVESEPETAFAVRSAWPRVSMYDMGASFLLQADVPGLREKDVQLQLTQDVLTLSGERKVEVPQGYSVHRQERAPVRFSRSVALPVKVNGDQISATLKDGVLTVTLPKSPESQPRQIVVKGG